MSCPALFAALVLALHACAVQAITLQNPAFDVRHVIPGNTLQGITFTPTGDLYMTRDFCLQKYPAAANLPIGATLSPTPCANLQVPVTNLVSSQTGRLYTVNGYEIDTTAPHAMTQRWVDCGATHGIAVDPRDGAIFVSSVANGKIWRIPNPDLTPGVHQTNCADVYFDAGLLSPPTGIDGLTVGPDGTLYAAGYTARHLLIVSAWSLATPIGLLVAYPPAGPNTTPDGISICFGAGNSYAIVANIQSHISMWNLTGPGGAPTYAESTIASNVGGYLDFTAVDPKGCIWGTDVSVGTQGVYRITNADGTCGCASPQVPPEAPATGDCSNCTAIGHFLPTVTFASHQGAGNCVVIAFDLIQT